MDINKLSSEEFNNKLDKQSVEEQLLNIPEILIQFSGNKIINYCLSKKVGLKDEPSPRVLGNWADKGLVKINPEDKGKIKRFDKLESTWLNILVELRGFGLSIESLQRTRRILFNYVVKDFSLFKFHFLNTILREPQTLVVYKDGDARILPTDIYLTLNSKKRFFSHVRLNLDDFIKPEYPNLQLESNYGITEELESIEKLKLLYFLKTGGYQYMKVKLSDSDIRYIENIEMLLKSEDALKAFSEWNFEEIIISIDDEVETIITSKY